MAENMYVDDVEEDEDAPVGGPPTAQTLDTTLGKVQKDKYLVEVKSAKFDRVKDKETGVVKERVVVQLEVCHGPYSGLKVKDWIGLDMTNRWAAKKIKNFYEALLGEKLGNDLPISWEQDADDSYHLENVRGEKIGVWLVEKEDEGFVNVDFGGYVPAWDPNATDDEEPF